MELEEEEGEEKGTFSLVHPPFNCLAPLIRYLLPPNLPTFQPSNLPTFQPPPPPPPSPLLPSQLDLIFHSDKVHYVLDEIVMGGMVLETNITHIMQAINDQSKLHKQSTATYGPGQGGTEKGGGGR